MTPEQALFLTQTSLPTLEREHAFTLQVLKALPPDKGDYRPEPVAKTALDLAAHIALSENTFLAGIATGEFDFSGSRPESMKTTADAARWYAESFAANLAVIKSRTPEQLAAPIDFMGLFQMPAAAFLTLTMHHSIHHRGQLTTYLRPMGGKVPSIYGESYDSAEARKAASAT
jgi:uncharacterized damage-inducible protein DinB